MIFFNPYKEQTIFDASLPASIFIFSRVLCLPRYPDLQKSQVDTIMRIILLRLDLYVA